ncbi:prepilin peptidase [Calidifontibacter terrae]
MPYAVALAALTGLVVGVLVRRHLAGGLHRRPADLAVVPRFRWVPVAFAVALPVVVWRVATLTWWAVPAYAVLTVVAVALAAVDSDVHRLPDRLTLGSMPVVAALLMVGSAATGQWTRLAVAAVSGLAVGGLFLLLALAAPSGLGLGDVKLAALLGGALGWLGALTVVAWLFQGFLFGGLWALLLVVTRRATRHTHIAFGPPLLLGAVTGILTG